MARSQRLVVHALTPARWAAFERLFGSRGACGGCWCMLWRLRRAEFEANKGAGNKQAMRRIVGAGAEPGLLAERGGETIGWCALAPRADYPALQRSRLLKPVDAQEVWVVSCLFVAKPFRRQGVSVALLRAACRHVRQKGGRILEGYPQEPRRGAIPDVFAWTGVASAYAKAGFVEVARPSPTRPIMRRVLGRG
jgi:GNAT superfamily N-acetyltransferase